MDIKEKTFSVRMSDQEADTKNFNDLDELLYKALFVIINASPKLCYNLVDIIIEVMAGTSRNKNIYSKFKYSPSEERSNALIKDRDLYFINNCMLFINSLAVKSPNSKQIVKLIKNASFLRIIIEGIVLKFDNFYKDYIKNTIHSVIIQNKIQEKGNQEPVQELWSDYFQTIDKLKDVEDYIGIKREKLYGIFLQVREIILLIDKINDEITLPYLRVVYSVAKKITKDLSKFKVNYQNGATGLLYAKGCFDQQREKSFGAYARLWVRQAVLIGIKLDNFIKLPLNVWRSHAEIEKKLPQRYNIDDAPEDVLKEITDKNITHINKIRQNIKLAKPFSLDHVVNEESNTQKEITLSDKLSDESLNENTDNVMVRESINLLTYFERSVICLYFGMIDLLPEKSILFGKECKIKPKDLLGEKLRQRYIANK